MVRACETKFCQLKCSIATSDRKEVEATKDIRQTKEDQKIRNMDINVTAEMGHRESVTDRITSSSVKPDGRERI